MISAQLRQLWNNMLCYSHPVPPPVPVVRLSLHKGRNIAAGLFCSPVTQIKPFPGVPALLVWNASCARFPGMVRQFRQHACARFQRIEKPSGVPLPALVCFVSDMVERSTFPRSFFILFAGFFHASGQIIACSLFMPLWGKYQAIAGVLPLAFVGFGSRPALAFMRTEKEACAVACLSSVGYG